MLCLLPLLLVMIGWGVISILCLIQFHNLSCSILATPNTYIKPVILASQILLFYVQLLLALNRR